MAPTKQKKAKLEIPGYKLRKRLGSGGQASVYLAVQLSMNRPVALKVVPPAPDLGDAEIARFLREARVLARLRHENIVGAIDYGEIQGLRYLVMEYIEGDSVLDFIKRDGALEVRRSLEIVLQICRALGYVAKHGIIHRDIKPANLVITDEARAVLVDFGLARRGVSDGLVTIAGMSIGTPNYMSPEQIRGVDEIDIRSDLYALGGTFFHMMTGRVPFPASSQAEILARHLKDRLDLPEDLPHEIPADVLAVVRRAMAKDRDKRYETADAMAADLLKVIERLAGVDESDPGIEPLELMDEVPERRGPSLTERVRDLGAEKDRLTEENRKLLARVGGVRKKAKELLDQGARELGKVRRAKEKSDERVATLEVELRALNGRTEAVEDQLHRREEVRDEALRKLDELTAARASLEASLRDAEAAAARAVADATAARARIGELESGLARRTETVDEESVRKAENLAAEIDRLERERDALRERARDQVRALAERDALKGRLRQLEERLAETDTRATRLEASREVESEAAARDVAGLRGSLETITRDLAAARVELRDARSEAERGRADAVGAREELERETRRLEEALRVLEEERDREGEATAAEMEALRARLAEVEERDVTARHELARAREARDVLAAGVEAERSRAAARDRAVEDLEQRLEAARGEAEDSSARRDALDLEYRRLRDELVGLREDAARTRELEARLAIIEEDREAGEARAREQAEAAAESRAAREGEIRAVRTERDSLRVRLASLEQEGNRHTDAERDALVSRVHDLEERLGRAETEAAGLDAAREVEAEAASREMTALRGRIGELSRKHADADVRAREATAEAERVRADAAGEMREMEEERARLERRLEEDAERAQTDAVGAREDLDRETRRLEESLRVLEAQRRREGEAAAAEMETLQARLAEVEERDATARDELARGREARDALVAEVDAERSRTASKDRAVEDLEQRLAEARGEAEDASARRAALALEYRRLRDELAGLREDAARMRELEARLAIVEEDREAAESRVREQAEAAAERLAAREGEVRAVRTERDSLRARLASLEQEGSRQTDAERDALVSRIRDLEERLGRAETEVAGLEAAREVEAEASTRELAALRDRIGELSRKQADADVRAREARTEAERVRADAAEEMREVEEDRARLERRLEEGADRMEVLRKRLESAEGRNRDLERATTRSESATQDALEHAEEKCERLSGRLAEASRRVAGLESQVEELTRDAEEASERGARERDGRRREREAAGRAQAKAGERIEALDGERARLEAELESVAAEASRVRAAGEEAARRATDAETAILEARRERDGFAGRVEALQAATEEGEQELRARLDGLIETRDALAREAESARQEANRLRAEAGQEVEDLREAVRRAEVERDRALAKGATVRDATAAADEEMARRARELADLSAERDELRAEVDSLREQQASREAARVETKRTRDETDQRQSSARRELERRLRAREEELERRDAEFRAAERAHREALDTEREQRDAALAERAQLGERVEEQGHAMARASATEQMLVAERDRLVEQVETIRTELLKREAEHGESEAPSPAKESKMTGEDGAPITTMDEAERVAAYTLRRVLELKRELKSLEKTHRSELDRVRSDLERVTGELDRANTERRTLAREKTEAVRELDARKTSWKETRGRLEKELISTRRERDAARAARDEVAGHRREERARLAVRLRRLRERLAVLKQMSETLRAENEALVVDRGEISAMLSTPVLDAAPKPRAKRAKRPSAKPRTAGDAMTTQAIPTAEIVEEAEASASLTPADTRRMVLVPRGPFIAGEDEGAENDRPRREEELDGYWIDLYLVTNGQYAEFVETSGHWLPDHWTEGTIPKGLENHPVVHVTYADAMAYARWRGASLPTPLQWQKAARAIDGRRYPWGDEPEVTRCNCRETGFIRTTPAGQFRTGRSPYGLYDMAGNVSEWVQVKFVRDGKVTRVVCGGSFRDPIARAVCASRHGYPDGGKAPFVGFRCAVPKRPRNGE